jgi:hypothetical protein
MSIQGFEIFIHTEGQKKCPDIGNRFFFLNFYCNPASFKKGKHCSLTQRW